MRSSCIQAYVTVEAVVNVMPTLGGKLLCDCDTSSIEVLLAL